MTILTGELEAAGGPDAESVFASIRRRVATSSVVIDVGGVTFCDSTGLALFVDVLRAAGPGCTVTMRNPSAHVQRLLMATGLDWWIEVSHTDRGGSGAPSA